MNGIARLVLAGRLHLAWLAVVLWFSAAAGAQTNCSDCHEQGKKVAASVHGAVGCAQCHLKHDAYPHPAGTPKPQCATCHEDQAGQHARSVHGQESRKGNTAAPECSTCHGAAHEVTRASAETFRKVVPQTCGMCHAEVQAHFEQSVHGVAVAKGVTGAPVCTDCHG